MCGIAGVLDTERATAADALGSLVEQMAGTLAHRGPDDAGTWVDAAHGIGLGFRRLSIVDLSPAGHQPMASPSGRYIAAFNGEVYDHRRIRAELVGRGVRFRGTSDTEVLLGSIDELGVEAALRDANLMCALAVWDRQEATLTLARDRLGEKPLAWGWADRMLVFGSELKALRAHPAFSSDLDPTAVAAYLRFTYVPHPATVARDARQLPPGSLVVLRPDELRPGSWPEPRPWWTLDDALTRGAAGRRRPADLTNAADTVAELLSDSVALRRQADVPVGAFLSGGIDSSTVVALLRAGGDDVRSFCVAMPDAGLDESAAASAVARHLGADHTTIELAVDDALAVVPRLPTMYDEPFADPSALPTHLVAAAARSEVTVALTGDGGDEVFGGYNRHVLGPSTWRRVSRLPAGVRRAGAAAIQKVRPHHWDTLARVTPPRLRVADPGQKAGKLAELLRATDDRDVARTLLSTWEPASVLGRGGVAVEAATALDTALPAGLAPLERLLFVDTVLGLPDGMLTKVDRASMACSLEVRPPMLDHRLVELVWSLPPSVRIDRGRGKVVLREVLGRHLPTAMIERPKRGFDPPIGTWLRGPLRPWADDLLAPDRVSCDGWLDPEPIRTKWCEHVAGTRRWDYALWTILCFVGWYEAWTT